MAIRAQVFSPVIVALMVLTLTPGVPTPVVPSVPDHTPATVAQTQMATPPLATQDKAATQARLERAFGQLPLYFVENQGQMDERVAYYIQGSEKTIYFAPEGVTFALTAPLTQTAASPGAHTAALRPVAFRSGRETPLERQRWVVKLDFVGANPDVRPVGENQQEAVISYFKGQPDEWRTGLPTYSRLVYRDLWPGIDLAYYGTVGRLKYEFIVHPGADPAQIHLAYRGATTVALNAAGQLEVLTPIGGFTDDVPMAYQGIDGRRVDVAVAYVLQPASSPRGERLDREGREMARNTRNEISLSRLSSSFVTFAFQIGPYDPSHPLVLDPAVLVYCGYIAGGAGLGITVDDASNAYVTGHTSSDETTFPAAVGPDLTYNGIQDAFVVKVNATGTVLLYAGYIGGSDQDIGYGIAVDGAGNAYVMGTSNSTEVTFPVVVGPDLTYNGGDWDAFVAKVNPAGTALVYCGYVGGSGSESDWNYGGSIAVDGMDNAYIVGTSNSTEATLPVVVGPDLTYNGGDWDAFVAKVNPAGTALVYCGYIGGSDADRGYGISVDGPGNAYVTGYTLSSEATFPVTMGPDLTHNGSADVFAVKVSQSGAGLLYAGYIGGTDYDIGHSITVDSAGNAHITGETQSTEATFPVIMGPDLIHNGNGDAFVAKVNMAGTALVYCGYIGGSGRDGGLDIVVDGAGNADITGFTESAATTFPVVVGPDLTYNGGFLDAFVAKVNADGIDLAYCGYIGGLDWDEGLGIAVDRTGNAYVTGLTESTEDTFPVTVGPDLTYNGGAWDAFVAKVGGEPETKAWTLMFYLDGDNNLDSTYSLPVFNRLEAAANNPSIQLVAAWDRWGANNSAYYRVEYDTALNNLAVYTDTVNYWPKGELNMGTTGTLVDFVNWARTNYPAQHYALILSDHGSGLGGAMWDDTSSGDHLTVSEIGAALASVTLTGTNKINVLYMDACLMGMIEDAYQVRDYVDWYVASENIKFGFDAPHFQAISSISATTTPAQLAVLFTITYGDACNAASYPCTMSTADILKLSSVVTATNSLAQLLNSQMATSAITLTTIRSTVQRFEMNGDDVINSSDDYIDLYDFARLVKANYSDSSLQAAAQAVMDAITVYITTEYHGSGTTGGHVWNLNNSHGVAVFFPSTASSFYSISNYDFATGATWPGASLLSLHANQATVEWGPMLVSYFKTTQPGGPDDPTPPELMPLRLEFRVYLPLVLRNY